MCKTKTIALATVCMLMVSASAYAQRVSARAGYLGLAFEQVVTQANNENSERLIVREVSKDSPAEKAGLKAGDASVRINGLSASSGKFALAHPLVVGDTVRLRVQRDGKEREIAVVAAPRPANYGMYRPSREIVIAPDSIRRLMLKYLDSARVHLDSIRLPSIRILSGGDDSIISLRIMPGFGRMWRADSLPFRRDSSELHMWRALPRLPGVEGELAPGVVMRSMELGARSVGGAELTVLDPAMVDYFKTDRGLLVLRVAAETPADRAGLEPGDVIVNAKGRAVNRVDDLRAIVAANPEAVKLEILRKGARKEIELKTRR